MKPTLLILAAGMGSRYGGLKQLDEFGPSGETILEYSIYDAIRAGFGKVVFVIRESFADEFKSRFEAKLNGKIETEYVFQELNNLPDGYDLPAERVKPWGTGHAVLMAKDAINEPFVIINADDFYGQAAFSTAAKYLANKSAENEYCMIGYHLHKTLSEHGSVSRGVCNFDSDKNLIEINERTKIQAEGDKIYFYEEDKKTELAPTTPVSMNCWAFKPGFFDHLTTGFQAFLDRAGKELKSEYFFPFEVSDQLKADSITVKVVDSDADWFGVTYPEDKPEVQSQLSSLIERGDYPNNLWA